MRGNPTGPDPNPLVTELPYSTHNAGKRAPRCLGYVYGDVDWSPTSDIGIDIDIDRWELRASPLWDWEWIAKKWESTTRTPPRVAIYLGKVGKQHSTAQHVRNTVVFVESLGTLGVCSQRSVSRGFVLVRHISELPHRRTLQERTRLTTELLNDIQRGRNKKASAPIVRKPPNSHIISPFGEPRNVFHEDPPRSPRR